MRGGEKMKLSNVKVNNLIIREFDQHADSIEELTRLLNRAYKALADMGFRYVASHQDAKITADRIKDACRLIGLRDQQIVATIS
jgi:hypothetical protein